MLFNLTPHEINVADADGNIVLSLPKCANPVRLVPEYEIVGNEDRIPVVKSVFPVASVKDVVEKIDDVLRVTGATRVVVSTVVAQAVADHFSTGVVVSPDTFFNVVRDEKNQVKAVRRFQCF